MLSSPCLQLTVGPRQVAHPLGFCTNTRGEHRVLEASCQPDALSFWAGSGSSVLTACVVPGDGALLSSSPEVGDATST